MEKNMILKKEIMKGYINMEKKMDMEKYIFIIILIGVTALNMNLVI